MKINIILLIIIIIAIALCLFVGYRITNRPIEVVPQGPQGPQVSQKQTTWIPQPWKPGNATGTVLTVQPVKYPTAAAIAPNSMIVPKTCYSFENGDKICQ